MKYKRNIISVIEESKTSHVKQAYNQLVAKNNKKKSADTLAYQIKVSCVNKDIVDQYHLLFAVIYLVKKMTEHMWVNSF